MIKYLNYVLMKLAILSDCHAGQGETSPELRLQIQHAIERGTDYIGECGARIHMLLGDTVHHLGNTLQAAQTRKEISLEHLAPLEKLLRAQPQASHAIAGNTDWLLSSIHDRESMCQLWFEFTGFPQEKIAFPAGGLWHETEFSNARLLQVHGHVFDRAQRGDTHRPRPADYPVLLKDLRDPPAELIENISAPFGSHAQSTNRMASLGKYVKRLPDAIRPVVANTVGWAMKTREFEPEFARLLTLSGIRQETQARCIGIMGHSHIAGIRQYGEATVVNTGSFGARNIPSQRISDQKAHVVIIDNQHETLELVQTFDPRHPEKKPVKVKALNLATGTRL